MVKISQGNTKMGKIPSVSLPPIKSCINCDSCARDCYALKAYRLYKNTRVAYDHNFDLARDDSAEYFNGIRSYLTKKKPSFFRWHVSGDIISQSYLNNMVKVALEYPEITFLAFTKHFRLDYRKVPNNLSIVFSMWPGMKKPVHKTGVSGFAWMQDGTEKRCPRGAIECPGNCETCGMCFQIAKIGGHVVFKKH